MEIIMANYYILPYCAVKSEIMAVNFVSRFKSQKLWWWMVKWFVSEMMTPTPRVHLLIKSRFIRWYLLSLRYHKKGVMPEWRGTGRIICTHFTTFDFPTQFVIRVLAVHFEKYEGNLSLKLENLTPQHSTTSAKLGFRAHSHWAMAKSKAKIFFDVCRLHFDLFCWFFDFFSLLFWLLLTVNGPWLFGKTRLLKHWQFLIRFFLVIFHAMPIKNLKPIFDFITSINKRGYGSETSVPTSRIVARVSL